MVHIHANLQILILGRVKISHKNFPSFHLQIYRHFVYEKLPAKKGYFKKDS